jgi:hypothetical protein
MFKNYLTYQFAVSFDREVSAVELPNPYRADLQRCAREMLNHFTRSIQTQDPKERSKSLFVALTYLRDCGDILNQNPMIQKEPLESVRAKFVVLSLRLEHLCSDASLVEGGQLRMFA